MDTDAMRYFQQVADGVTVTEVAELYQVSQPGVSRSLKRLEEEVGTALLFRAGRVLRTTHAGRVFKRHVDAVLHAFDNGLAATEELIDPETGRIRVAFQRSLGAWLVPTLVADFRAEHPRIRFAFAHSLDSEFIVAEGWADLEVTARRPPEGEVAWRPILRQRLCLAVPPGHRLEDRPQVSLAEAVEEDFIMLGPGWELRATSMELCEQAGFVPRLAFELDDLATVGGFVAAGLGVAIMPAMPAEIRGIAVPGHERLIRLTDAGAYRDVGLAWSTSRRLLPAARLFRRHALEVGPSVAH